jgi:hypothetical protein
MAYVSALGGHRLKPGKVKGEKPGKLDGKLLTGVCQNALW